MFNVNPTPMKVMISGLFSLVLTMGIARFSYTPLLPVMMNETFLTDASGGWLATFNYMGYMAGALIAASVSDLKLKDSLYRVGLLLSILTTFGMAFAENYVLWSIMRFLAGFGAAAGLLIGSGLVLNWMLRHGHRPALGIHFGGAGLGIAISAIVSMWMVDEYTWAQQWQFFALVGCFMAIPAWFWLPRPESSEAASRAHRLLDNPPNKKWMLTLYAAYFCAGVGYVITATFLVTIINTQESLQGYGSSVWLVMGLAATPACIVWDKIALRLTQLKALMAAYTLNCVGIIIPVFDSSLFGVMMSAVLFGVTFIGIVSLMLTMVGKFFPTKPAKPMGKLTLSYGAAQIITPAIAGVIAEKSGNYNSSLIFAAMMMVVGVFLLIKLSHQEQY